MPKDAPLAVDVPAPSRDNPGWVKVGVITAVAFVVGIAWPRVFGVRLGPSAPGGGAAAASASMAGSGGRAPDVPPATVVAKTSLPVPTLAPSAAASSAVAPAPAVGSPTISVHKGAVLSCKTVDGETRKGKECGAAPGIDALVTPRVRKLATCAGVEGQTGKLSLVVNADFGSGRFSHDVGKSSTLSNLESIASCLKTIFHGTSMTTTPHDHSRYTVAYNVMFTSGAGGAADVEDTALRTREKSEAKAKDSNEKKEERGERTEKSERNDKSDKDTEITWEIAPVRDAPKTGGLITGLPRGTKVKVGSAKDGWYPIKFGDGFAKEGWVHRGAIGR